MKIPSNPTLGKIKALQEQQAALFAAGKMPTREEMEAYRNEIKAAMSELGGNRSAERENLRHSIQAKIKSKLDQMEANNKELTSLLEAENTKRENIAALPFKKRLK